MEGSRNQRYINGRGRRKIRRIESNAKCRHLKKLTCIRDFAAGVYLPEALSPPRFLFGVV